MYENPGLQPVTDGLRVCLIGKGRQTGHIVQVATISDLADTPAALLIRGRWEDKEIFHAAAYGTEAVLLHAFGSGPPSVQTVRSKNSDKEKIFSLVNLEPACLFCGVVSQSEKGDVSLLLHA
jgi:hypothetical protein